VPPEKIVSDFAPDGQAYLRAGLKNLNETISGVSA
jgi:hypothetical protein